MNKRIAFTAAVALLFAFSISACRKPETELEMGREFATSSDIAIRTGPTEAVISWSEAVNTDSTVSSYTVEVSKDSLFASAEKLTYRVDAPTVTVTDREINIRTTYYARVKTNGATSEKDSRWIRSKGFQITGEQIFQAVRDAEVKHNSVILRWRDTTGAALVKITLTPAGGTPTDYPLTQTDIDSSYKKIEGLEPATDYSAQIYSTEKEKGLIRFRTKDVPVYAYTLSPGTDLTAVLDTCAGSIIIGLEPGVYTTTATCQLKNKSVTLMSVSGTPDDTKIIFTEFKLMGNGAGINLKDLSFEGGTGALYFLNFAGLASDAEAATFANVSLENCRVNSYGNCLLRANRGTAAGDHKIGSIAINNCIFSNNLLTNLYTEFTLDRLQFQTFTCTNSTFYNAGRALVLASTVLPAGAPVPQVTFDYCTINHLGTGATRILLDANANPIKVVFTNSIIANAPRSGTLSNDMIRATGVGSTVTFSYNNYFKLTNGSSVALTIPAYVTQAGNQTIDLGWTPSTTGFSLPSSSPLRSASSNGTAIGDPRWH